MSCIMTAIWKQTRRENDRVGKEKRQKGGAGGRGGFASVTFDSGHHKLTAPAFLMRKK